MEEGRTCFPGEVKLPFCLMLSERPGLGTHRDIPRE